MTEQRKAQLKRRLQEARYRLLKRQEALAFPLREMLFVATKEVWRISTNGACIYFDPDWLKKLENDALDFMLAHQLAHLALGHTGRPKFYKGDRFHLACDIVANSRLCALGLGAERIPGVGTIYSETFFPRVEGRLLTAQEAMQRVPFDPADLSPGRRRNYMIDAEDWWDRREDRGAGGTVVLSPADEDPADLAYCPSSLRPKVQWRKEVFEKETYREQEDPKKKKKDGWSAAAKEEISALRKTKARDRVFGGENAMTERAWLHAGAGGLDWRLLLHRFLQEQVWDYTFAPPDRRMQDLGFCLPDFHIETERPKEILFMVDTSGSVEDAVLERVYRELVRALEQFQGGLIGRLGFFDLRVYPPRPFAAPEELARIVPRGGGGTDFCCVVKHLNEMEIPATGAVIFTDGCGTFPKDPPIVPVLWIFTDRRAKAPWGSAAYL